MKEAEQEVADTIANFKYICITILEVGNFLNTTTRNKFAVGYKMDSLLKTGDTKSPHRKGVTLLTYVAMHCQKVKPEAINMPADMEPCAEAFRYPYDMLAGDISKISADVKKMDGYVKKGEECKKENPDDKWAEQCAAFINKMRAEVLSLEQTVQLLEERVKSLCVLFADSPNAKAGDDIFRKIDQFATMFANGVKFLEDAEAKRLKEIVSSRTCPASALFSSCHLLVGRDRKKRKKLKKKNARRKRKKPRLLKRKKQPLKRRQRKLRRRRPKATKAKKRGRNERSAKTSQVTKSARIDQKGGKGERIEKPKIRNKELLEIQNSPPLCNQPLC